jgi:outer membrane protein assembly factor BamB
VIAGETQGAFQGSNHGATDAFATMFPPNVDATTPPLWTVQLGEASNDGFASVAIRGDGVLIAGGVTWRPTMVDAGPSSEVRSWVVALAPADGHVVWARDWSNALDPELIRVATVGNDAYALGHYNFKDKLSHHAFVTRLDSLGNLAWEALLPIEMTTQAARSSALDLTAANGRVVAAYLAVDSARIVALDAQKTVGFEQSTALCSGGVAAGMNGSLVCTEAKGTATTRLHVDAAGLATLAAMPVSGTGIAAAEAPSELIVVHRTDVRNPGPGLVPRIWFLQPSFDE